MLLVLVGMEPNDVWYLAVAEPLQTLTGLRVPQLHLTVVAARQELSSIVRERYILDGLHVTVECPQAVSVSVYIP